MDKSKYSSYEHAISSSGWSRRSFVFAGMCLSSSSALSRAQIAQREQLPPVRAITQGSKFHWFGYYDKLQFNPEIRYVLGNEVEFQGREPGPSDTLRVGMVDLEDHDRWIDLGESRAWNWQQGCMLQWLPGGSMTEVIWNDRQEHRFVSHILDVKTGKRRTLPAPIHALSYDSRWALFLDFSRLRPGYRYAGIPDPNKDVAAPDNSGIWKMDMRTGKYDLVISLADIAKIPGPHTKMHGVKQWIESELLFSPDNSRFAFLHQWGSVGREEGTRMFTASADGKDLYLLDPHGYANHFWWRDPKHIISWTWNPSHEFGYYLFEDRTQNVELIGAGVMPHRNGHVSYLQDKEWVLCDNYAEEDENRKQSPFLYNTHSNKLYWLGHFYSPPEYGNEELRVDTHPRHSPNDHYVVIDSPHGLNGRQMYLIDIAGIVA